MSCGSSGAEWSPNSIITCGGGPPQTVMETGPGRRFESCPQVQVVSWFGGLVAQWLEQIPHKDETAGSIPAEPTKHVHVAQMDGAHLCGG